MQNLTKREIVQQIYQDKEECRRGDILQNDVKDIVQRTLDILSDSLAKGRNVELRNFGVLEVQVRPKRAIVKFKAGKELKAALKLLDLSKVEARK